MGRRCPVAVVLLYLTIHNVLLAVVDCRPARRFVFLATPIPSLKSVVLATNRDYGNPPVADVALGPIIGRYAVDHVCAFPDNPRSQYRRVDRNDAHKLQNSQC